MVQRALYAAACLVLLAAGMALTPATARALPAFAAQTGQPCQMCHVGGFGPQLTPYGRDFKLKGYTQRATSPSVPLSVMAVASYVNTAKGQAEPPAPHFSTNDNFAFDQVSVFLAGGLGAHFGGFAQVTWDGVAKSWSWDNLDLRMTTTVKIRGVNTVLGVSVNNNPGVQDPWNTLPAWGFPYTDSALAPSPSAAPLLSEGLAQTSLGATAYAWINSQFYIEGGAYGSPSAGTLHSLGADPTSPGDIKGAAPYGRLAYQRKIGGGVAEVGLVGLEAEIHPGRDRTTGLTDRYTDLGLDASYYYKRPNGDVITVNGRYVHENQKLSASCALAAPVDEDTGIQLPPPEGCAHNHLDEFRADAAYYWRNWLGLTLSGFDVHGSTNTLVYPDNRTGKPDSSGLIVQLDATPFGGRSQPQRRINLRLGVQYTAYFTFNGASHDYDGTGRDASDNNTFRIFTWLAF